VIVLDRRQAGMLEAHLDERLEGALVAPKPEIDALLADRDIAEKALAPWRGERAIEWAAQTVTQGEVLRAFADHCEHELDEVEVLERADDVLVARWRRETSRIEQRAGFVAFERLASNVPTLLLGDVDGEEERLVEAFVDHADLRSRLAICDLARLERIGAPRSSVFVYLEWFLRDAYGVKLLPSSRFTQGLIDRGVISLGMG
jgi:hypothetical protein